MVWMTVVKKTMVAPLNQTYLVIIRMKMRQKAKEIVKKLTPQSSHKLLKVRKKVNQKVMVAPLTQASLVRINKLAVVKLKPTPMVNKSFE